MDARQVIIDEQPITYFTCGSGNPVMLVHGFAEDHTVWDRQSAFLKEKYFLIIPDLPGSGQSPMIKDMSMEGMADVLFAIVKNELKKDQRDTPVFILIGHSMGGYITLAYAEKYGPTLSGFGLFHSSAFADSDEKKTIRKKGIEFIQKNGAAAFIKSSTPNLFSPLTHEKNPPLIEKQMEATGNFSADTLVVYYQAMMRRPDRTFILKNAVVPVLFVIGKFDNAVPLADSLKQSHLPERSYIKILEKSGHMGMLEQPEESNQILENFLQ
jgi:pimeloyl-ACP methyl ester carboxylesterase